MKEDKQNKQNGVKGVKYNSWAIYRSDNCLEQWRRCRVLESGPIFTIVDYQNGKELGHDGMVSEIREVLTNEVIGMDEIGPFDDE